MNWYVNWKHSLETKLAGIWLNAPDRAAVTDAVRRIEEELRRSPETAGEQRDENRRLLTIRPMAVVFRVHAHDRRVDVLDVRRIA